MSELREHCSKWLNNFIAGDTLAIDALEAFAKEQQIKGMERIKQVLQEHHARVWLADRIDAAIQQLKEGG